LPATQDDGTGISKSDAAVIVNELATLGLDEATIIRTDLTCSALIREYWRSLSLQ
jgi:hypothetical protein